MAGAFLGRPGSAGAIGALMDEYARAAEELCRRVESLDPGSFERERASTDPDCRSLRAICEHVVFAATGYANYLRRMQRLPAPLPDSPERVAQRRPVAAPGSFRGLLADAVQATEDAAEGLRALSDEEIGALTLRVGWGPTYDPEAMLEHAIVHLLRHRRQIDRWDASPCASL